MSDRNEMWLDAKLPKRGLQNRITVDVRSIVIHWRRRVESQFTRRQERRSG